MARRQRERREWAAALLAGAALYAAGAWVIHRTWPPAWAARPAPEPLRFVFQPDAGAEPGPSVWDRDPRALWSPVLFALPSEAGFSPARYKRQRNPSPLLSERPPPALLLDRLAVGTTTQLLAQRTGVEIAQMLAQRWVAVPPPEEPFMRLMPTSVVLNVAWPDGAPEVTGGMPLVLDPPLGPDEKPWEAMATLFFSDSGEVRSVFLEQSTAGRERSDSLVRALRRLRIAPGRSVSHRVTLFLQRPLQSAARSQEAAP